MSPRTDGVNEDRDALDERGAAIDREPVGGLLRALTGNWPMPVPNQPNGVAWRHITLIGLLLVVAPTAVGLFTGPNLAAGEEIRLVPLTASTGLRAFLAICVAWWLVRARSVVPAALGLRWPGTAPMVGWSCLALLSTYMILIATAIVLAVIVALGPGWLQEAFASDAQQRALLFSSMELDRPWLVAGLLVLVAVHEELVFRGLLMPYLARLAGGRWWVGVVGQAVVFGALHVAQGWTGVIQTTGIGMLLGILALLAGSIWPVVVAHFAFDWLQFQLIRVLLPFLEYGMGGMPVP